MILTIDLETYATIDLRSAGLYAYAEDAEILLFGYAFDGEPVRVVDLAQGEALPQRVRDALLDPTITKTAWNAAFEIAVIRNFLGIELDVSQWACTMVHAYYLGLPGSLANAAKSLKLDVQKDAAGTRLINYWSKPCQPTIVNGGRTRNLPEHDPEKWQAFIGYCAQDVEVERAIRSKLELMPVPEREQRLWVLDQNINRRGVLVDAALVSHAVACDTQHQAKLRKEAEMLTGLSNPNSVAQLSGWLAQNGHETESLAKAAVAELIEETDNPRVQRALELRQEMARTSVKKYEAMDRARCRDDRVRGLLQFYGANRTGRWAGRLVQVQNLPRNRMRDLDLARRVLRSGEYTVLELLWDSVPDVLSQLIRTTLIPTPGYVFVASDFSAIEARVVAWLADESWRLDVFADHGKIYEASASQMFHVPIDQIDRGSPLRQKGKVAELALGYQGGPNALIAMGALEQGLTEDELPGLVRAWRAASPRIVQLWDDVGSAAMTAVRDQRTVRLQRGLGFSHESGLLRIALPSGRHLHYVRPNIEMDHRFGREGLTYEGSEAGRWGRLRTFGGKLVENITQAVARDCLAEALLRLDEAGYDRTVFHVHDEIVLEVPAGSGEVAAAQVTEIMGRPIKWAPGLPLRADAFCCEYYRKED